MQTTCVTLDPHYRIAEVDPRIFGGFLEHIGRAVYEGVYDPQSKHADEDGFRRDVMAALREQRYTVMRYPGGNFVSGYHWTDGVGPKNQRPRVRELAWQSLEPNQFGTDEYIKLCRKMDWTPMLTVNLGTGTPEEARNWLEYTNCPPGTLYADMRKANGSTDPYGVKLWCLGNEMDGPWQLGHVPADQYAIRAQQTAKLMKDTDPTVELIVCGSCTMDLPSYMEWDRTVMEHVAGYADYVSLHRYVGNRARNTADYLAVTASIDRQIEEMDSVCRFVQARLRSKKRYYLAFDEWNVWYKATRPEDMNGEGLFAPHLVEEIYNLEDALVAAGFLNSFLRHADVLKIANLAQIVNVIAPMLTRGDELLLQSLYDIFLMYAKRREGTALLPVVEGPVYESSSYGETKIIDASAVLGEGKLHVFLTNRSLRSASRVEVRPGGLALKGLESAEALWGESAEQANSFEQPNLLRSRKLEDVRLTAKKAVVTLPPLCAAALTFKV